MVCVLMGGDWAVQFTRRRRSRKPLRAGDEAEGPEAKPRTSPPQPPLSEAERGDIGSAPPSPLRRGGGRGGEVWGFAPTRPTRLPPYDGVRVQRLKSPIPGTPRGGRMPARFCVLASGSAGNCALVQTDGFGLLVD